MSAVMTKPAPPPDAVVLTKAEAAELLRISQKSVERLPPREIGRIQFGRAVRYLKSRVMRYAESLAAN
jgi:DNA-binding CsgD family transcriptional regulator